MTASDCVPRSLYPFEGHRIDIGGHSYHYLDEGSGDPLVMLHGNPTSYCAKTEPTVYAALL